jgi:hypothetical protein
MTISVIRSAFFETISQFDVIDSHVILQFSASASHDITSGSVGMRPPQTNLLLMTRPGVYISPYFGYSARSVIFST